jgi:hypothetical protein
MRFRTGNSLYEVDTIGKRIRRLNGTFNPTPRQGPDGEWREFLDILNLQESQSAIIIWGVSGDTLKTTMTSEIKEIDLLSQENE